MKKINLLKRFFPLLICILPLQSSALDVGEGGNIVIIENVTEEEVTQCLGFLLNKNIILTASRCTANPHSTKVYRSLKDYHARHNELTVKPGNYNAELNANEPATMTLVHPVFGLAQAYIVKPSMYNDPEDRMSSYFLIKNGTHLDFFQRPVVFDDKHWKIHDGVFQVLTNTTATFPHSFTPIPGAILIRWDQATLGVSYENGQLYSPMHGFLIPFHTIPTLPRKSEL